jgi:hypothetical protein
MIAAGPPSGSGEDAKRRPDPGAFLSNRFTRNEWSVFHRRNSPIMTSMPPTMSDLLKRGCDPPHISKESLRPDFALYLKWVYARARDEPHGSALPKQPRCEQTLQEVRHGSKREKLSVSKSSPLGPH